MAANADGIITRLYFFLPSPPPLPPSPSPFHVYYIVRLIDCHTDWITPLFLLLLTFFFTLCSHLSLSLCLSASTSSRTYSFEISSFCSPMNYIPFFCSLSIIFPPLLLLTLFFGVKFDGLRHMLYMVCSEVESKGYVLVALISYSRCLSLCIL